jgi:hypothetical protein
MIDYDPRGQNIVCTHAVNLLTLPLDPANFIVKHPRPIPESVTAHQMLRLNLGWFAMKIARAISSSVWFAKGGGGFAIKIARLPSKSDSENG